MIANAHVPFLDLVTPHEELEQELVAVFRSALHTAGFIGGPMVEGFEREFAAFSKTQFCVGVGNGTDALRFALMAAGVPRIRMETQLSPAWSTDWIAPEARAKLREYGIAPPAAGGLHSARIDVSGLRSPRRARAVVACPRCGSERTRVLSQFGSTACKAQYRCDTCLEPFDYFKPH